MFFSLVYFFGAPYSTFTIRRHERGSEPKASIAPLRTSADYNSSHIQEFLGAVGRVKKDEKGINDACSSIVGKS